MVQIVDFENIVNGVVTDTDIETTIGENKVIKFDPSTYVLKESGRLFNGTLDYFKLYATNKLLNHDAPLLIEARNIVIINGAVTIRQSDVISGNLSSLLLETEYYFHLFNNEFSKLALGKIILSLE